MQKRVVEKDWMSAAGLRCVVNRGGCLNHRCGYVALTPNHPLYGIEYSEKTKLLGAAVEGEQQVESYVAEVFNAHGGVTYSGGDNYPVEGVDLWWFGFDCAHSADEEDGGRSLEYVVAECESLATQLAAHALAFKCVIRIEEG